MKWLLRLTDISKSLQKTLDENKSKFDQAATIIDDKIKNEDFGSRTHVKDSKKKRKPYSVSEAIRNQGPVAQPESDKHDDHSDKDHSDDDRSRSRSSDSRKDIDSEDSDRGKNRRSKKSKSSLAREDKREADKDKRREKKAKK